MSENQNSINSNELEANMGEIPSGIHKDSSDNTRKATEQNDTNTTTTTNNQNIIVNGNNDMSKNSLHT